MNWRQFGDTNYDVSDTGLVRRRKTVRKGWEAGSLVKTPLGSAGYPKTRLVVCGITQRDFHVHELVALLFIGPRPVGKVVNHIDADRQNNHVENLEYVSQGENIRHARSMGRLATGQRHGRHTMPENSARGERTNTAVLTVDDVLEIRKRRASGLFMNEIAAQFGVCTSSVFNIISGKTWRHVP